MKKLLIIVMLLLVACQYGKINNSYNDYEESYVTRVIDGDTIVLSDENKVRLICVDTPERGKLFYKEATQYTKNKVENKTVYLEKDVSNTDRYGRLLRYVYYYEGDNLVSLNNQLVKDGMAMVYKYPPDINHCDEYSKSAKYAAENKIGLWNRGD